MKSYEITAEIITVRCVGGLILGQLPSSRGEQPRCVPAWFHSKWLGLRHLRDWLGAAVSTKPHVRPVGFVGHSWLSTSVILGCRLFLVANNLLQFLPGDCWLCCSRQSSVYSTSTIIAWFTIVNPSY